MPKYKAEVEYADDSASMAGSHCGTILRAGFFTVEASDRDSVADELRKLFRDKMYYSTIRRISGIVET